MKTLINMAAIVLLTAGAVSAQQITVQGERKINTDFKKYKTYSWLDEGSQSPKLIEYTYEEIVDPSASTTTTMTKPASNKMDKKDKYMRRHRKPNEVVVYSYSYYIPSMDSNTNRTVTNAVNNEMEGRGYRKNVSNPDLLVAYKIFDKSTKIKGYNDDGIINVAGTEVRTTDTVTYNLKPGTVMITMMDAKTNTVVWEGFASGVAANGDVINDKVKIREAINLIFKKYEWRADKLSMNN